MKDGLYAGLGILGTILVIILLLVFVFGIQGLVLWGIGSFIVWAFKVNFVWTFWHGVAIAIVISLLRNAFEITVKKED